MDAVCAHSIRVCDSGSSQSGAPGRALAGGRPARPDGALAHETPAHAEVLHACLRVAVWVLAGGIPRHGHAAPLLTSLARCARVRGWPSAETGSSWPTSIASRRHLHMRTSALPARVLLRGPALARDMRVRFKSRRATHSVHFAQRRTRICRCRGFRDARSPCPARLCSRV